MLAERELDRLTQLGNDAPAVLSGRHEVLFDELGRQPHERPGAVLAFGGGRGALGVDVGADDLDVLDVDLGPVLEQPDGDRVGLLAGGAGHRPYAQRLAGPLGAYAFSQQVGRQAAQLVVFAVEIGLVDSKGVDELFDFSVGVAAQIGEIGPEGRDPERVHAVGDPSLDVIALGFAEQHAGASVEELADRAQFLL